MVANNLDSAMEELRRAFPGRFAAGEPARRAHANTLTWIARELPDAVVWPESTEEVARIVRIAGAAGVPLIPFGAGTSLEGHVNAPRGGLAVDMRRMTRILAVNARDRDCTVEAGATRAVLDARLSGTGLFFSVDSGAEDATLGGLAATRASGTASVRYGTMRENVLALTAVMADGTIVRTGGRARKSAAGYDLTHLLVGSEGTLAILTEITVRLCPLPEAITALACSFPSVAAACEMTMASLARDLGIARVELLDAALMGVLNRQHGLDHPELPALFIEIHGTPATVAGAGQRVELIASNHGAVRTARASGEDERRQLWRARHDAFWAIKAAWPEKDLLVTDVCLPVSRLAECIGETENDRSRSGLVAPMLGHVGDGNRAARQAGHSLGRNMHRGARHRPRQARASRRGARRGRRRDAPDQTVSRSGEHSQPGKNIRHPVGARGRR